MSFLPKQWLLISRATANPRLRTQACRTEVPDLQDGEVVVRHHHLSLDPHARRDGCENYVNATALNEVMIGGRGRGRGVEEPAYAVGDPVWAWGGSCTSMAAADLGGLRKVTQPHSLVRLSRGRHAGRIAWYGLNKIIEPRRAKLSGGQRCVGGTVGQLAKVRGAWQSPRRRPRQMPPA
jgi:NADPH-dependent curcumin reductase CurA